MIGPAGSLRLALFSDGAVPLLGAGAGRALDRLVTAVRERGGDVRVFSSGGRDVEGRDDLHEALPAVPLWAFPDLRVTAPARARVSQALAAWRPTLVHASSPFGVGLAGRAAARSLGVPFVTAYQPALAAYATGGGLSVLRRPGWAFLRWFHNGGARTYCPSRAAAAELRTHGVERLAVWSPGFDVEAFGPERRSEALRASLGADADTFIIVTSGRLALAEGFQVACRVVRLVQQTTTRRILWAVAGAGADVARCRAAAPPETIFLGALDQTALATLYASADLVLSTSSGSTIGEGVREAMASGTPVLAASNALTREMLAGTRGATATANDVEAFALRLISLIGDPRERLVHRDHALAHARRHGWEQVIGDLVASFERITRDVRARERAARPSLGDRPIPTFVEPGLADVRGSITSLRPPSSTDRAVSADQPAPNA